MCGIPKDHKGLYACEPLDHSVQQILKRKLEVERTALGYWDGKFHFKEMKTEGGGTR